MNLMEMDYIREVIETKSISKVALNKHISQSALSQNIQKLENELGYKLLERNNKGVVPTGAGRILFKYSGTIIRIYEKMIEELEALDKSAENIRINGYRSFIDYSLPCLLYKVKKKYATYNFNMYTKAAMDSISDLFDDLTDICFVNEQPKDDRLDFCSIGREKIVLVANVNFNIPDVIDLEYLEKCEMILLDDESLSIGKFLEKKLKPVGLSIEKLPIMFKVDSIPAAKSSVNNQLGVCFLPYMSVKKELYEEQFKIIEVRNFDFDFMIYLVTRKKCNCSKAVQDVFQFLKDSGDKYFC